ncbi:hypothetical protein LCGC14_1837200, partial [marine sediment metagenome]
MSLVFFRFLRWLLRLLRWATATEIYISPTGSDSIGDGSAARPYRTLLKARNVLRDTASVAGARVWLNDGTYELTSAFALTDADSGVSGDPIRYDAVSGANPVISGGSVLDVTWTDTGSGIYKTNVGASRFRQFYVDDVRATRARSDWLLVYKWEPAT